jgi:hypothetical protein
MSRKKEYEAVYVIVRIDYFGSESIKPDITNPFPNKEIQNEGPNISFNGYSVTLKEIVTSVELAENEVRRLNEINSDKSCKYFWQSSRLFPENKSFGS